MEKIIIIGGRGTAIVIADQICDARKRFNASIEVLGLALDDLSGGDSISGYQILCGIKDLYQKYGIYDDVKFLYSLYRPDCMDERTKILYDLNIPLKSSQILSILQLCLRNLLYLALEMFFWLMWL